MWSKEISFFASWRLLHLGTVLPGVHVLEPLIKLLGVDGDLVLGLHVVVDTSEVVTGGSVDLGIHLVELLDGHLLQGEGRDGGIWILLLVGHVSDEEGDVLLKLGQVGNDVVLIELGVLIILSVLGNREEEVGPLEVIAHGLNVLLDGDHLLLDVLDLVIFLLHLRIHLVDVGGELLSNDLLLFLRHGTELLMSLDLSLNSLVLLLDHINLRIEHVNIVVETVVLLLSLDEGGNDLLSG